jgi:hypothetical protein
LGVARKNLPQRRNLGINWISSFEHYGILGYCLS